jgi:hypothetical protein
LFGATEAENGYNVYYFSPAAAKLAAVSSLATLASIGSLDDELQSFPTGDAEELVERRECADQLHRLKMRRRSDSVNRERWDTIQVIVSVSLTPTGNLRDVSRRLRPLREGIGADLAHPIL